MRRIGLPVAELPDETLLAGFGTGDEELAVAFVRRFQSKVFGVARSVVGDPHAAEDVAQQAFERAWRHARTYDPRRGSVGGWLSVIARNVAIDTVRVRTALPVDADELLHHVGAGSSPQPGPEAQTAADASATALQKALQRLPPDQARAVVLAGIGGLSATEVAASEGIPIGTAKTRIRTAMRRLRSSLEATEADRA